MMSVRLKTLKRAWFQTVRRTRLLRLTQDLNNYLHNTEILRGLPQVKRALVLSPHPDDESIGCGGTLALLAQAGVSVDVVMLTDGVVPENPTDLVQRRLDANRASQTLGIKAPHFLGAQDGELFLEKWAKEPLEEILAKENYPIIFCPWPMDGHSDHRHTFKIFQKASQRLKVPFQVWFYEVWSPLFANRVVEIDSVIDLKMKAINAYESEVAQIDYADKFLALARYRSLICRPAKYAEAFFVCDQDFIEKL